MSGKYERNHDRLPLSKTFLNRPSSHELATHLRVSASRSSGGSCALADRTFCCCSPISDALLRQTKQEVNDAIEPGLRGAAQRGQSVGTTGRKRPRSRDRQARARHRKSRSGKRSEPTGGPL